jgi:septal ring factor EnvC (AmiA/AmiB activator)
MKEKQQASTTRPANVQELEQYIASLESYLARPNGAHEEKRKDVHSQGNKSRNKSDAVASSSDGPSAKKH